MGAILGCYALFSMCTGSNTLLTRSSMENYQSSPIRSDKIRQRRLRFAGHCSRSQQEPVSKLLHWTPKHGRRKPGRPALNYSDILKQETGMESTELRDCNEGQEDLESHDSSRTPLDLSQVKSTHLFKHASVSTAHFSSHTYAFLQPA